MGAPSHKPPTTGPGGAGRASASQRLERQRGRRRIRARRRGKGGSVGRGERGNTAQPARSGAQPGRGSERREEGTEVEDKKEETREGDGAQRALYTRVKRRGRRLPQWGGAKPEAAAHRHGFYNMNLVLARQDDRNLHAQPELQYPRPCHFSKPSRLELESLGSRAICCLHVCSSGRHAQIMIQFLEEFLDSSSSVISPSLVQC